MRGPADWCWAPRSRAVCRDGISCGTIAGHRARLARSMCQRATAQRGLPQSKPAGGSEQPPHRLSIAPLPTTLAGGLPAAGGAAAGELCGAAGAAAGVHAAGNAAQAALQVTARRMAARRAPRSGSPWLAGWSGCSLRGTVAAATDVHACAALVVPSHTFLPGRVRVRP